MMKKILVGALQRSDSSYSFSMKNWRNSPKDIPAGTLVRFVYAPPRRGFGKELRPPGNDNFNENLDGQLAIVITGPDEDGYGWGGIFNLNTVRGDSLSHYGDFLEVVK